jgi:PAS domain S-box-containing protein
MHQFGFEASTTSLLAPALVAGAIVAAFFACHYSTERKNRRDFLRWCESNRPRPRAETLADPPTLGDHRWAHPSGIYGVGTAPHGIWGATDSVGYFVRKHARGYALAVLFVSLVLIARLLLDPVLQARLPYAFFSAAVLVTAIFAGVWETLLALILGFLAAEWFIIEPRSSFMISGALGWLAAIFYFTIGLGIVWFKRSESAAERQALASDIALLDRLKELDRERALRATLAHIVETGPDAVFSLTIEGRIMTWNAAVEKLLGYSGKEATHHPLAFIVPPEDRPRAEQMLGAVQRGEPNQSWQTTLNRKDGSRVEVSLAASAARDAQGKVVGVSVVARPRSSAGT